MHSSTGVKLPVREVAAALPDRVLLCLDGVHGFGVEDVDVARLGCHLFTSGCHKWLFGPRGTGVLWGQAEAWDQVLPTIPSFDGGSYGAWLRGTTPPSSPAGPRQTPGGFHSLEHRWALAEAFELHRAVGRAQVASRTHSLASRLKEGLAASKRVRLRTPRSPRLSAGLVCFEVDGVDPSLAVETLRRRHRIVASVTPYAARYVRFGPSIVNSEPEIDSALRAIRAL